MEITSISKTDNRANVELTSDELVILCNALFRVRDREEFKNREKYHKLYSELMLARDVSQYGHVDNFCLGRIVDQRTQYSKVNAEFNENLTERKRSSNTDDADDE